MITRGRPLVVWTALAVLGLGVVGCARTSTPTVPPPSPSASEHTPSETPSVEALACESEDSFTSTDPSTAELYFFCINDMVAVDIMLPRRGALRALVAASIRGPSSQQEALGYLGGIAGSPKFALRRLPGGGVNVDLDGGSFDPQRALSSGFPTTRLIVRTVRRYTGARQVRITVDGASLCSTNPECSGS